jgi:hypothetical protein
MFRFKRGLKPLPNEFSLNIIISIKQRAINFYLTVTRCIGQCPIQTPADNGAFYARKEGYVASQEGIERTYTCLCQRASGQAVCVDVKLLGTTEGLSQNMPYAPCYS